MTEKVPVFEIDGREYEWPGLADLTMRECRIFYEETGMVWESIWVGEVQIKDVFIREGFLSAMARIAYTREHPEARDDEVKAVIENQPRMNIFRGLLDAFEPEETQDPKAEAAVSGETSSSPTRNEPDSTPNGENMTPVTSGPAFDQSSVPPASSRDDIGTGASERTSTSPPAKLAT